MTTVDDLVTHQQRLVGDLRMHVAEAGDGPLVVLLHGFPDFWYSWRRQIPPLVHAGYRVVAPDLRGYADTEAPRGVRSYRLERLVDDVAGLITDVGESSAALVGHDWGGIVAWATAAEYPDMISRLAVCNSPHPRAFERALRSMGQGLRSSYVAFFMLPALPELTLRARDGDVLRRMLRAGAQHPDSFSDADLERYVDALLRRGDLTGPLNYYRASGERSLRRALNLDDLDLDAPDPRGRAARVAQPVLVLWGERDAALVPELADPPPESVPDARVVRFPDAGHWVHLDASEAVNTELLRFLSG